MRDNIKAIEASGRARHERALLNYEANKKYCFHCGKELGFENRRNKFCSHSCSSKSTNASQPKRKLIDKYCKNCNSIFTGANTFCDNCIANGAHIHSAKSTTDVKTSSAIRNFLIKKRGDKCEECGLSEWRGIKLTIQMHHIDGNPDNNIESNLILLCPNCHSITPNYGMKNPTSNNTSRNRKRRNLYHTGHFKDS